MIAVPATVDLYHCVLRDCVSHCIKQGRVYMYAHDNGLDFWIVNEMKYPLLPHLAQDLLSAPASEACVERVFSVCGKLSAGKRNRLMKGLETLALWILLHCMMYITLTISD